ncbi:MAG: AAA family ATPase [Desulfomonile tiedjei]|uniref:AAA family ATPase n=1 Tax=Desulfomonile tiedjei TaxID=2358 RepID=A0A9D6V624_9BACT|nr:AAA family ATPase [Desulfomonile tiedjei]
MDCHCKDHLPGEWHSHDDCDCSQHEFPAYTFVITKVMEEDPGVATVYISKSFMETLQVEDGDPVQLIGPTECVVQAKGHPNPWIDTRMVSVDKQTMEKTGVSLFSQVKIRKTLCGELESITLEIPPEANITRLGLRVMLEQAYGAVISGRDHLTLKDKRGRQIKFRIVEVQPEKMSAISRRTQVRLVNSNGDEYITKNDTTFKDVGGLEEAVRKVREVVQLPLRHPEIFYRLGMDPPRGVLLHGPSGTGKTLIARAVAGETGCYFKAISGTEIMDKYYGESEAKLRAAFEDAYQNAPAIIFIDEIDALAPRRDTAEGDVEKRVTAQLLALMDGMEDRGNVIILAATNLPNVLDNALRRPGRFDREILIGVPDRSGRRGILEIHTRDMPTKDIDLDELAEKTHGFVGADIKALCQEAGFKALRRILPGLEQTEEKLSEDFLEAIAVEKEDFEEALSEMRPSAGRSFEVDLRGCGWDRVAGYTEELEFLKEMILWPLRNVSALSDLGVSHPEGLLITGPSGVGKTLLARSLAKESGFNVIEIRGPELLSKYMGESERNIREVFRQARQMAPTVLILDGIDSIAVSGWSDSKVIDRIVNQLVMEMNTITSDKPILVVGVAARSEALPPALRATGRFGYELRLKPPDASDRAALFGMFLNKDKVRFHGDFNAATDISESLTGGDIEEVCRRVILQAAHCALDSHSAPLCEVEITENDVLKMLDRWKLSAS